MPSIRFKGGQQSERLNIASVLNNDMIQTRHDVGGATDSDKGIPFGLFQAMPVFNCTTAAGTIAKSAALISGVTNPDFELYNGRIISCHFANGNDATSPTFNCSGTAYPMRLPNQASSVNIGKGCWGADVWLQLQFVSDGTNSYWLILGHNIAQQDSSSTSGYTIYADGTTVYPTEHFAINKFVQPITFTDTMTFNGAGVWLGISSTSGLGTGACAVLVCRNSTGSSKSMHVVGGSSSPTATWSGNDTLTLKINGVALPTSWIQITNRYWYS